MKVIGIFLALLILTGGAIALSQLFGNASAQDRPVDPKKPTLVPAENLIPAPKPTDGRQVAILSIQLMSNEEGAVKQTQLLRGRIIESFAPNVFRKHGAWKVELAGERTVRYGVLDPRRISVYDGEEKVPHKQRLELDSTWDLVVPLFDGAKDLGVQTITIFDEQGNKIFSTPVDRAEWTKTRQ